MSSQVLVTLSDDSLRQAEVLAQYSSQDVSDVLSSTLETALRPLNLAPEEQLLQKMSDSEVLFLAKGSMPTHQSVQMRELLELQQETRLSVQQEAELAGFLKLYSAGTFRKARAIGEAIRRGLLQPNSL